MPVKATQTEETRHEEFDLEKWLKEGATGLRRCLKCSPPGPRLPEEFKTHTRAARKEMLLAVRSLLDSAIKEFEEAAPSAKQ
jgi:hypothetical protein